MSQWTITFRHPAKTLISSTRQDVGPQFSPGGRKLIFASDRTGNWEIWVCDSDGRNAAPLTSFNHLITGSPRWSRDGRQIVFDARVEDSADIYVVNIKGGAPRRLTTEPSEDFFYLTRATASFHPSYKRSRSPFLIRGSKRFSSRHCAEISFSLFQKLTARPAR